MSNLIEATSPSGSVVSLSLAEAVDAVQALSGPGPLSCDIAETLRHGGTLTVGSWSFTGRAHALADAGRADFAGLVLMLGVAALLVTLVAPLGFRVAELLGGVQ